MCIDYKTSKGVSFSFSGWLKGRSPIECWDRQEWLACLHGCMLIFSLLNDSEQTQLAIEDDGLLHELVHLASNIETCHHHPISDLRHSILELQNKFESITRGWINNE